ncbi:hypothetical protein MHBO_004155, partial [Bonamia ostreae]
PLHDTVANSAITISLTVVSETIQNNTITIVSASATTEWTTEKAVACFEFPDGLLLRPGRYFWKLEEFLLFPFYLGNSDQALESGGMVFFDWTKFDRSHPNSVLFPVDSEMGQPMFVFLFDAIPVDDLFEPLETFFRENVDLEGSLGNPNHYIDIDTVVDDVSDSDEEIRIIELDFRDLDRIVEELADELIGEIALDLKERLHNIVDFLRDLCRQICNGNVPAVTVHFRMSN